jgi:hypothetical protein
MSEKLILYYVKIEEVVRTILFPAERAWRVETRTIKKKTMVV